MFHHIKTAFNLEHLKINKYDNKPFIYHNINNIILECFLRYYNAYENYKNEDTGHYEYRNYKLSYIGYEDNNFIKKINNIICDDDGLINLDENYKNLPFKEYIQFITNYLKLSDNKFNEIIICDDFKINYGHIKIRNRYYHNNYKTDEYIKQYNNETIEDLYNEFVSIKNNDKR